MDDIPNITPVKPLWPKRPNEDSKKHPPNDDEDAKKEKNKSSNQPGPHDPDYDGQIDEYV